MNSKLLQAHIALFFVAVIYSANYTIAKIVLDDNYVSPIGLVCLRMVGASVLFFLFALTRRSNFSIKRKDFPLLFLCILLGIFLNQILFLTGLKYTKPIEASLIMTNIPVIVLIASALLLKEKITLLKILGILSAAFGAIAIITYKQQFSFSITNLGNLMILSNATSFAFFLVLVKKLLQKYSNDVILSWSFLVGFILILPLSVQDLQQVQWNELPKIVYLSIAYVMVFTSFFAYNLNTFALATLRPSAVSIYVYLQPVITTIIAVLAGKDKLSLIHIFGGMLIFIGVFLVSINFEGKLNGKRIE